MAYISGLLAAAGSLASARVVLGAAGSFADSIVADLEEALQAPKIETRLASAEALSRLSPDATLEGPH